MKVRTTKTYIAFDGKEFEDKIECEKYELAHINLKAIRFFDQNCRRIQIKQDPEWIKDTFKKKIDGNGFFIVDNEEDAITTLFILEQFFILPEFKGEYRAGSLKSGQVYLYRQNGSTEIEKAIKEARDSLERNLAWLNTSESNRDKLHDDKYYIDLWSRPLNELTAAQDKFNNMKCFYK